MEKVTLILLPEGDKIVFSDGQAVSIPIPRLEALQLARAIQTADSTGDRVEIQISTIPFA